VRCLRDGDGRPDELVAMVQDITARKLAQEELERAMAAAEAANHSKSDFLARMSHEIRTPMHIIFGMTDMALEGKLSTEQRDYLSRSQSAAKTLLVLINDILDLSKMEAGKLVLQRREFDVREWLHDILSPLTWLAGGKRLGLGIRIDEVVPRRLVADPDRLAQVVVNLVSNAIKYTDEGRVDVIVHAGGEPTEIHIEVADTGVGIPVERQAAIFDAFVQGAGEVQEGTGLGLAICSRLVELMGGRIWVESEIGVGSHFHFTARTTVPGRRRSVG
jgi:two-component system, sensor histidine kinase and response regulator